jgi:hypothetical protein
MRAVLILLLLGLLGCDSTGIELESDVPREPTGDPVDPVDPWRPDPYPDPDVDPYVPPPTDSDSDTISDEDEGFRWYQDTDGDTVPDYLDSDSDNDGLTDILEAGDRDITTPPIDTDSDRTPDFQDTDSDGNGVPDSIEGYVDTDDDATPDYRDFDNDGDGINDETEIGENPDSPVDHDHDRHPDYLDTDSDNDTILDMHERPAHMDLDADTVPDRHDLDSDGDTIPDMTEAGDTDPPTPPVDTDGDGTPDFRDLDSDGDGLPDLWEAENGLDPTSEDSDMDMIPDLLEVGCLSDPLDSSSTPSSPAVWCFRMSFDVDPSPVMGTVVVATTSGSSAWATTEVRDDASDSVDTVSAFLSRVEPNIYGGVADPEDPTRICVSGLSVEDRFAPLDGNPDSFTSVPADTILCFDIYPKRNVTVTGTDEPQVYPAELDLVTGSGVLETRQLSFFIPPVFDYP